MVAELPRKLAAQLTEGELKPWRQTWFHNFGPLGLPPGGFQTEVNLGYQLEKQGDIFRQTRDALNRVGRGARGLCLTSTDGLFGLYPLTKGAGHIDIFNVTEYAGNNEPWHMDQTRIAAKLLDMVEKSTIEVRDIKTVKGPYDFAVCVGVLNNFLDPAPVLAQLREIVHGPLVTHEHTFVIPVHEQKNMKNRIGMLTRDIKFNKQLSKREFAEARRELDELESPNHRLYYQSPADLRQWGSRFSHDTLIIMAVDAGWTVINEKHAEVPPVNRLDRGSSSLLSV
jgi:hypothetical protein